MPQWPAVLRKASTASGMPRPVSGYRLRGDLNWVTLLSRAQRPRLDLVPLCEWWLCNNRGLSPDSQPNPTNEEHRYNPLGTACWVVTLTHLKYSGNQCLGGATTAKLTDVL
uniref:Uncharacterized protein n=1 Tax=Ananas comosus var. bracteatus TaxID=296719 RepID=A0A6V7NII7_ANACO|nr:unnamed protein product [Ananas comosus var. bracteatus]